MKIDFNPTVVFQLLVLIQGITTSAILLFRANTPAPYRWLAWLILAMSGQMVDRFLNVSGLYRDYNYLYFSPLFFGWAYGVLLYGYFAADTSADGRFRLRHQYLHFVPVMLQCVFYTCLVGQDLAFKTWFWKTWHKPYTRYVDYYIGVVCVLLYVAYFYRQHWAGLSKWRYWLIWGVIGFYLIASIDPLLNHWYLPAYAPKFYLLEMVLPIITYWLALVAYLRIVATKPAPKPPTPAPRSPADTGLMERIKQLMDTQKPYLDPELTLNDLAQQLHTHANNVSHCLNVGFGQTFNDFVNGYRVAEVKHKLSSDLAHRLTILGIAFESGFNSKTTFNRVFKEMTGYSPKAYKNMSHATLRDDGAAV